MIIFTKAHPVTQAMSAAARPADLNEAGLRRNPGEPNAEQAESNSYKKPTMQWQGLTIAIENPAGSIRRGRNRHGVTWEVRMRFDYGEIVGTLGVDGDPVDVIVGPNLEALMVYVVHQRRVNDWENYDEDKCCVGFSSQSDAEQAFLSNYNDPRFLGPITALPVAEFVAKVRATKEKPAMIKAILFFKAHVGSYLRGGRMVSGYQGRDAKPAAGQMSLFGGDMSGKPLPPSPLQGKDAVEATPDMFADQQTEAAAPTAKPSITSKAGDLAHRLRGLVDKHVAEEDRARLYAGEANRLRVTADKMVSNPDVRREYSEAADILDGWAKTAGSSGPAKPPKILFVKPVNSSNLSNNQPVANKQELKMEAKTVEQLKAELKAAETVMDTELSEARKFKQSDKVMNEGGGGYRRSEDLAESAYNRNMPKIKAAKQALFEAVWTPEVTAQRRAAWGVEASKIRTTPQLLKLQEKFGFTLAELKIAVALNEGK